MEKKKQRSWKQILAMAFTFAMVMVFAGITGKVDANAYETKYCKVTVKVTDKETGAEIPGAQVIFTDYYSPYGAIEVTQMKTEPIICHMKMMDGDCIIGIMRQQLDINPA